ncbi:MAG: HAD family phosphatase [Bacteroidia bacterium]|nr:HAD family phosphatase [Bacteroidia bacterium]
MITNVFFDFDGVVIDSEPIHAKTKAMALDAFGIAYPENVFEGFRGVPEVDFFIYVRKNLDAERFPLETLIKKRQEILAEILPEMSLIAGFTNFMEWVKSKKIRTALVTSATHREVQNIDKHLNIIRLFDKVIPADATGRHKPFPDPYLKALEVMEADKEQTIIIEDSTNGVLSGKRAGCTVYALTTTFSRKELACSGADMIFESYEELKEFVCTVLND